MDIFVPNRKLWTPDNRIIRNLTPHRVMMGAAGSAASGSSYDFDGSGDRLKVTPTDASFDLGSGDFNFNCWVHADVITSGGISCLYDETGSGYYGWYLNIDASNIIVAQGYFSDNSSWNIAGEDQTISATTWTHVELSRTGNNIYLFVAGVQSGSTYAIGSSKSLNTCSNFYIAAATANEIAFNGLDGRMDEVRLLKGVGGHTSGFTPPTAPYTSDANTSFLLHCDETKTGTTGSGATSTDSGNIGHTVTEIGNAIENTTIFKY